MPVTLSNVMALPDILDAVRMNLMISPVPGVISNKEVQELYIKSVAITPPVTRIGQVRVGLLGHYTSWRGMADNGNTFSATFYEDSKGYTVYALTKWREICCTTENTNSKRKTDYARTASIEAYDTAGKIAYRIKMTGVWPMMVTSPPSAESSTAARVDVQFSFDFSDLEVYNQQSMHSANKFAEAFVGNKGSSR